MIGCSYQSRTLRVNGSSCDNIGPYRTIAGVPHNGSVCECIIMINSRIGTGKKTFAFCCLSEAKRGIKGGITGDSCFCENMMAVRNRATLQQNSNPFLTYLYIKDTR